MAKDYNQNALTMNSIIQKLARLDEQLRSELEMMRDCENWVKDTKSRKDELEVYISNEIDKIRKDLYAKLNGMLDNLRDHQMNQRADALKLQQEISILKKEKLDLYQKINEVQKRISDMELTIGQDISVK